MRLYSSGVSIAAVVVFAIACGDSEDGSPAPAPVAVEAGTPAPVPDAGAVVEPEPPPAPKLLKAGLAFVYGATTNGYIVFAGEGGLEVISAEGGTTVKLPGYSGGVSDRLAVSGGAVAWWTSVKDGFGVLNVWNATDGVKAAITTSSFVSDGPATLFAASADGRRIAYWSGEDASAADLHVLDLATGESSPATGALPERFAIDVWACDMRARFLGKRLITSFCDLGGAEHVYAVGGDDVIGVRIDPGFDDRGDRLRGWNADDAGNRVYLQQSSEPSGYLVDLTDLSDVASSSIRADEGFLTKDGAALVYRVGEEVHRLEGEKDTLLASPVQRLWELSSDGAKGLVFDGQAQRVVDTRMAVPPLLITSQATAVPAFTASGRMVVSQAANPELATLTVSATSASGGPTRELAAGVMLSVPAPEGDGLITLGKLDLAPGAFPSGELQHIDAATGETMNLGSGVLPGAFVGKKFVYTKVKEPGAGLYVFDPKK